MLGRFFYTLCRKKNTADFQNADNWIPKIIICRKKDLLFLLKNIY